jgi:flagellar biosynthetic protein FlhB
MSDESGDKTEEPTSKKLDDARKRGQVWKSKDLTGVAVFLVGLGAVKGTWGNVEKEISDLFRFTFAQIAHPENLANATSLSLYLAVRAVMLLTIPVVGSAAVIGGLLEFLQVGSLFTMDPLIPKFDKLNPLSGLKNMFNKKAIVELLKNLIKISVAAYVVYGVVRDAMPLVVETVRQDTRAIMGIMGELVYRVCVRIGVLFALFGIFDVWWQRKSFMKDMMMTKEEVKKEYKESEGDPHHKAKRKELHQEIMEGAQMEAVKDADVIVTNPDHVAVALKYDREKDGAPRVLAKGLDFKAERIKAIAREADVPALRNVPLAHALVRVEVGHEVPEELYDAVAEVLNFVYGLKTGAAPGVGRGRDRDRAQVRHPEGRGAAHRRQGDAAQGGEDPRNRQAVRRPRHAQRVAGQRAVPRGRGPGDSRGAVRRGRRGPQFRLHPSARAGGRTLRGAGRHPPTWSEVHAPCPESTTSPPRRPCGRGGDLAACASGWWIRPSSSARSCARQATRRTRRWRPRRCWTSSPRRTPPRSCGCPRPPTRVGMRRTSRASATGPTWPASPGTATPSSAACWSAACPR